MSARGFRHSPPPSNGRRAARMLASWALIIFLGWALYSLAERSVTWVEIADREATEMRDRAARERRARDLESGPLVPDSGAPPSQQETTP